MDDRSTGKDKVRGDKKSDGLRREGLMQGVCRLQGRDLEAQRWHS